MPASAVCDWEVKLGAVHSSISTKSIGAYSNIHFEKHLHFSGREFIITFPTSLFTSLPPSLPLLSVSNTAKTSALCRWVSLSCLPTTGSSMNGHLMRHIVERKRSSCHRRRTLFLCGSFSTQTLNTPPPLPTPTFLSLSLVCPFAVVNNISAKQAA